MQTAKQNNSALSPYARRLKEPVTRLTQEKWSRTEAVDERETGNGIGGFDARRRFGFIVHVEGGTGRQCAGERNSQRGT